MCGMRVQSNKINLRCRENKHKANTNCILVGLHGNEMKAKSYSISAAAAYECGVCNSAKEVVFMMKMMVVGWWCQPNYNKWARLLTTVSVSKKKRARPCRKKDLLSSGVACDYGAVQTGSTPSFVYK